MHISGLLLGIEDTEKNTILFSLLRQRAKQGMSELNFLWALDSP